MRTPKEKIQIESLQLNLFYLILYHAGALLHIGGGVS